jgi:hypothetical protein
LFEVDEVLCLNCSVLIDRHRKLVQFLNTGVFIFEKAFEPKSTYSTKPKTEDYDPNSRFKRRLATILRFGYWLETCWA